MLAAKPNVTQKPIPITFTKHLGVENIVSCDFKANFKICLRFNITFAPGLVVPHSDGLGRSAADYHLEIVLYEQLAESCWFDLAFSMDALLK